jgi:molybdopterin-guanine dinucleotide biosynthesis protein A
MMMTSRGQKRAAPECTGVIMAGGSATRFSGSHKGLLPVGGRRIIDRVADALTPSCNQLLIIANHPSARDWLPGARVRPDVYEGAAGLGGIHAALARSGTNVIIVAWDMPFVPASLISSLRDAGADADAVLPASSSRHGLEPLCAFYSQACLPPIEVALASGAKMPIAFHEDVRLRVLSQAEVSRHGDPEVIFMNVNTPADLLRAEEIAESRGDARPPDENL